MCCTFGDATDVTWWREHQLPLIALLTRAGLLSEDGGPYAGLTLAQARARIVADLRAEGLLLESRETAQTIRAHERCGTPLEILETSQWFIRVLDSSRRCWRLAGRSPGTRRICRCATSTGSQT